MKAIFAAAIIGLLAAGLTAYYLLAPESAAATAGQGVPAGAVVTTIREMVAHPERVKGREVTIRGKLVEICPTTRCWGYVEDGTGRMRWDSEAAGWAMPGNWKGKQGMVRGTVVLKEDGSPEIAAAGARL